MTRDSAATKGRILEAATAEFAAHGLAGARVDRLAARAGANKQLIYAYFQSKENLFDSAVEANIGRLMDEVPFDASDLATYVQALFDFGRAHPELARLARWHGLERPGMMLKLPQAAASMVRKVSALAHAQAAGEIDDALPAPQLLELLLALVHSTEAGDPADGAREDAAALREALAVAVHRLTAPQRKPAF